MLCFFTRSIAGVLVDVVISEKHAAEMEIAEHPVEAGAKISDHAWRTPRTVDIEGAIQWPRSVFAYEQLLRVQERAEPFTIVTGFKVYSNMLIKSVEATRDDTHSRALKFTAKLQEVIIVASRPTSGDDRAQAETNTGRQAATPRASSSAGAGRTAIDRAANAESATHQRFLDSMGVR